MVFTRLLVPSWGQNKGSDTLLSMFKIESLLKDNSSDALIDLKAVSILSSIDGTPRPPSC